jgi:hypothetical protein
MFPDAIKTLILRAECARRPNFAESRHSYFGKLEVQNEDLVTVYVDIQFAGELEFARLLLCGLRELGDPWVAIHAVSQEVYEALSQQGG